jgi:hypothetical protein
VKRPKLIRPKLDTLTVEPKQAIVSVFNEGLMQPTGPGIRSSFHEKPYRLMPDHRLTIGLFAAQQPGSIWSDSHHLRTGVR